MCSWEEITRRGEDEKRGKGEAGGNEVRGAEEKQLPGVVVITVRGYGGKRW